MILQSLLQPPRWRTISIVGECWRPIAIPKQIERVETWKSVPWKHMSIFKWDYYAWFSTCWQQDRTSVSWIVLSYSLRAWTKSESDLMWILKTHVYTNIWWIMKESKHVLSSLIYIYICVCYLVAGGLLQCLSAKKVQQRQHLFVGI